MERNRHAFNSYYCILTKLVELTTRALEDFQFLLLYSRIPADLHAVLREISAFNSYYCIHTCTLSVVTHLSTTFNSYYCIQREKKRLKRMSSTTLSILIIVFRGGPGSVDQ